MFNWISYILYMDNNWGLMFGFHIPSSLKPCHGLLQYLSLLVFNKIIYCSYIWLVSIFDIIFYNTSNCWIVIFLSAPLSIHWDPCVVCLSWVWLGLPSSDVLPTILAIKNIYCIRLVMVYNKRLCLHVYEANFSNILIFISAIL